MITSVVLSKIVTQCEMVSRRNYFTNVYGAARSLMAAALLIILVCNPQKILFPRHLYEDSNIFYFHKGYNLFFLFGYEGYQLSLVLALSILILVILGVFPRFTGILHWWVSYSFLDSCFVADGGDQVASVLTFLLIPITLMDGRWNHWVKKSVPSSSYVNFLCYCVFLMIEFQVAVIYLEASISKPLKTAEWMDGTAFYYWINSNMYGASDFVLSFLNPLLKHKFFVAGITWGILVLEFLLFIVFFMKREKKIKMFKYAVLLHFFIIFCHGLFTFFVVMTAALLLYLLPKDAFLDKKLLGKIICK